MHRLLCQLSFGSLIAALPALLLVPSNNIRAQQGASALEEIVVTARRREESLVDTPISITAFTEVDLEARQISQIHQIAEATPNLVFDRRAGHSNHASRIFIRGVGQVDHVPTRQPGVGLYVDGVYIGQQAGSLVDIVDIATVEVLRGPQGTLFGRNTIGGAVQINTVKPTEEFGADLELLAGDYNRSRVKGQVNIPFSDTFYGKFSGILQEKDGFTNTPNAPPGNRGAGGDDITAVRAALRWVPQDSLTVDLSADYTEAESNGPPAVLGSTVNNAPNTRSAMYNAQVAPALGVGVFDDRYYLGPETYTSLTGNLNDQHLEVSGANLTVQWDFAENLSFKSITTLRAAEQNAETDSDQSPLHVFNGSDYFDGEQRSQEFQLSGTSFDDRMQWVTGLYYFEEQWFHINPVFFPTFHLDSGSKVDNKSSAVFGQFTYDISDRMSFTLGARHTDEKLDSIADDTHSFITAWFCPRGGPPPAAASCRAEGPGFAGYAQVAPPPAPGSFRIMRNDEIFESDQTRFEPYVNLAYDFTDSLMGYASYSEGFKGGGFTQRIPPGRLIEQFGPEFAEVFEIGAKWAGEFVRVSAAVFYNDYLDLQVTTNRLLGGTTENASDAVIKGGEFEVLAAVTDRFTISVGLGYLDGVYKDVDPAVNFEPTNRIPFLTEWQRNASASYVFPVGAGELIARLDYYYSDDYYTEADNYPETFFDAYDLLNGSLTFVHGSGRWEAGIQGRNIADEYYKVSGSQARGNHGWTQHIVGPPAEWAARVAFNF